MSWGAIAGRVRELRQQRRVARAGLPGGVARVRRRVHEGLGHLRARGVAAPPHPGLPLPRRRVRRPLEQGVLPGGRRRRRLRHRRGGGGGRNCCILRGIVQGAGRLGQEQREPGRHHRHARRSAAIHFTVTADDRTRKHHYIYIRPSISERKKHSYVVKCSIIFSIFQSVLLLSTVDDFFQEIIFVRSSVERAAFRRDLN